MEGVVPSGAAPEADRHEGQVRYDPVRGYMADGIPDTPVGTLDEIKKHNLPEKLFRSCSEPAYNERGEEVGGCPLWRICSMSYRGLPASEGGGPRNHCWELIKSPGNGGGISRSVRPCYEGVARQDDAFENDAVLRVIADEGEEYELLTTVPDPSGGVDANGAKKWVKKLLKLTVEPFKRLGEDEKLATHELRASIIEREKENVRKERAAKNLGVERVGKALDARDRGSNKGAEKKD